MSLIVMRCPNNCGGFTYPRPRQARHHAPKEQFTPEQLDEIRRYNAHQCATIDGTCQRCWNEQHGYGRNASRNNRPGFRTPAKYTHTMTDDEIQRARENLKNYWKDRRRRGVDPEGNPAELLGNGGLYCIQVP